MAKSSERELGDFLKACREEKGLTLREVEKETDISNAYLSQLEGRKIKKPSPVILGKLSMLYETSYSLLMRLASYPVPEIEPTSLLQSRIGVTTKEEEDAIVEYLEFIRAKRKRSE